jgi:hypothetical protein
MKTLFWIRWLRWLLMFATLMSCGLASTRGATENSMTGVSGSVTGLPVLDGQVQYQEDQLFQGRLIWRFNTPPSVRVVYTWYTVAKGVIQQQGGGSFVQDKDSAESLLFLLPSENDNQLVLDFSGQIGPHPKALTTSGNTEIPVDTRFDQAIFSGNAHFTSNDTFPLWRGDWIAGGKIVKSLILVARLEPADVSSESTGKSENSAGLPLDVAPPVNATKHIYTSPWGVAVEGIQARLESNMSNPTSDKELWFAIDLRNEGKLQHVSFDTFQGPHGIRIDGVTPKLDLPGWSGSHMALDLPPGTTSGYMNRIRSVVFRPQYYLAADGSSPFVLTPGKHTLSCAASLLIDPGQNARYIDVYTAPLEIEIAPSAQP